MRTVFAALNAKYAHTNLAVRSVAAYCQSRGIDDVEIWERTVHLPRRRLLAQLAEREADVVVFSCYIWNIGLIRSLAADLRKIRPGTLLLTAGPEVSHRSDAFLADNPAIDGVIPGEGEAVTAALLRRLAATPQKERRRIARAVEAGPPMNMDDLPFPYRDLDALAGRTLYYESMRGCPFRCSYCLSSVDGGPVRCRSLERVFDDLSRFLAAGAERVKLVDRTFNGDGPRARAIWRWLAERDNGITCFHFELAGDLLDEESLRLLETLRPGLVQFEMGVQSTHPETLAAIRRPADTGKLFANAARLRQAGNIHLHLDLIAGLPLEDGAAFARSFDDVYALGPHQLQLGFLKVLRGSAMEREAAEWGILYSGEPPYEVLETRQLSFSELQRLHAAADMVERYYNSGRFTYLIREMVARFPSPFAFYSALGESFHARGYGDAPPSKLGYYDFLGEFMAEKGIPASERLQWLCRYDMALHEKPKASPVWVKVDGSAPHRDRILAFYADPENLRRHLPGEVGREPKEILRRAHVEVFPFDPETGEAGERAVLFDYSRRDVAGRAKSRTVPLEKAAPMV